MFARGLILLLSAVLLSLGSARGGPADAIPPPRPAGSDAPALFRTYCFECHSGDTRRGGLALDRLLDAKADRRQWEKVWKTVRHEFMPPAHADRPTDAERRTIARWVEREVFRADDTRPDPGRVTIRRLNRVEYQYTVQDLFGIDLDVAGELPPDDTAFGFDNIGDALTVSPALLDTYLALAEKIVAAALVTDGPRHPRTQLRPADFRPKPAGKDAVRAEQAAKVELKHDGRYQVDVQFGVGGWQEFAGEYDVAVSLGGKPVGAKRTISVGGNRTYTFAGEVTLSKGSHELMVATEPAGAARGKAKALPVSPRVTVTGPLGTDVYEWPESHTRVFSRGPAPTDPAARRTYAREILGRIAGRAFRRPVEAATLDRLTNLALAGPNFEAGVGQAITAVLTSPRFFFRAELQPRPDDPAEVHPLDEFALASRLSYLLWLSLPDDELTALAATGRLRAELPRQVQRMLADPRSKRFFEDFGGQWLRTRNALLAPVTFKDMGWIDQLRPHMKRETDLLFEFVAREDRDLTELLTANYTFLNDKLAAHYGVKGVTGDEFRRVPLPADGRRAGILTHAGVLLSTSNPNRTSPVKRGLFVLENLLGREVPPPPPNVGSLEDVKAAGAEPKTLREQLAIHREKASCAACHAHFDPIGLALENFDTTGRWRDRDAGGPVDPRTELATGEPIGGAADLAKALAARKDVFYRCATEKLLTYALGRGLEPADAPTVDRIAARVAEGGGRFSVLLAGVTQSPQFQMRRGDAGESRELARGGMGVVYRAFEPSAGRDVAVKVLHDEYRGDARMAARFIAESRITAQLQHPGVPPVFEVGELPDGSPFLAMKLIKGDTLADRLKARPDPARDRGHFVAAFEQVCQAVGYAHAHGVIHRDLKPHNVMVGAHSEIQVMDWGLAKVLTEGGAPVTLGEADTTFGTEIRSDRDDAGKTRAGAVLGTPAYMAREQAIGAIDQVDQRSDVFGLGAILCVVLTGRPPYPAPDGEAARQMAAVANLGDTFGRLDGCGAEPGLVALCKRCLSPDKADRPPDGGAVAAAVADLRADAERRARQAELDRVRAEAEAAEQRKRRRVQLALAAAVVVILAGGGGFGWWQDRQAAARRLAEFKTETEVANARASVGQLLDAAVGLRQRYLFGDAARALDEAERLTAEGAAELRPAVDAARADLAFVRDLDDIRMKRSIWVAELGGKGGFDTAGAVKAYPAAFQARGLDVLGGDPAAVAAAVAASPIRAELVAALDDWAALPPEAATASRLLAVLRRADPGPWLDAFRDPAARSNAAALWWLARSADPATLRPATLTALAELMTARGVDPSEFLLRVQFVYPGDYLFPFQLGLWHDGRRERDAAIAHYRTARVTRPGNLTILINLGLALKDKGDADGAIAAYREAIRHDPKLAAAHTNLGSVYLGQKKYPEAITCARAAIRADPKYSNAHALLGLSLQNTGDLPGARAALTEAARLDPRWKPRLAKLPPVPVAPPPRPVDR